MNTQNTKARSTDRILVLKPIDGKKPKSSTGLVDPRLFTGENKLHAVMNPRNTLWGLKYEMGALPPPLQKTWTNFTALKKDVDGYFSSRNLEIIEVQD